MIGLNKRLSAHLPWSLASRNPTEDFCGVHCIVALEDLDIGVANHLLQKYPQDVAGQLMRAPATRLDQNLQRFPIVKKLTLR